MGTLRTISDLLISKYLYYFLRDHRFNCYLKNKITGANINNLSSDILLQYKIPLPPLEIQQRIVSELDGYQNIINGARQVVDNWKPHIDIDPEWEKVKLGEVCEIKSGGTPPTREASYYENGDIPWLKSEVCKNEIVTEPKTFISKEGLNNSSAKWLIENSTLIALVGATIGKTALITFKATTNQNVAGLYPKKLEQINPFYLYFDLLLP